MAGAASAIVCRKTPWALGILVCYVALGSVFWQPAQSSIPMLAPVRLPALLSNLAVIGGLLYWLHAERAASSNALASDA